METDKDAYVASEWVEYRVVCTVPAEERRLSPQDFEDFYTRVLDKPYMGDDLAESAQRWADHCDGKDDDESTYHSSCRPHHVESRVVRATAWASGSAEMSEAEAMTTAVSRTLLTQGLITEDDARWTPQNAEPCAEPRCGCHHGTAERWDDCTYSRGGDR